MLPILGSPENFIMARGASTVAPMIDWLMYFILWVCVIFGALIFIGTAWLAWRFRHKPGINDIGHGPTHSNLLEIVWSVIPGIIVLLIAIWGFQGYMTLAVLPPPNDADTLEIGVNAYKWGWSFEYPNGHTEPTLHVPVNMKIRLVLSSQDVIHSLYLVQFRTKKDVVPGRFNKFWFEATDVSPMGKNLSRNKPDGTPEDLDPSDPNTYSIDDTLVAKGDAQEIEKTKSGFDIFCAEYCGTGHSRMRSHVYVHDSYESWKKWLDNASDVYRDNQPAKVVGLKLVRANGCFACHSIDGSRGTGPSWKDVFGAPVRFNDGTSINDADENYVRESILYPQAKIVETFGPAMPSYLGKLSDRDIASITAYIKSLSSHYGGKDIDQPVPKMNQDKTKTK